MDFKANFTAIDFETANRRPDSACQLAAVRVRDGQIVASKTWWIRPQPLRFSPTHIRIHGITPERVRDEPHFGQSWGEISQTLGQDCLVAHNASFDVGVLRACLQTHRIAIPELQFTCTRAIARRTWRHQRRYGLKPLATWLGIRFRHHDALEDSLACARILLAAGIDREATDLPDLEKRLRLRRGTAGQWGQRTPAAGRRRPRPRVVESAAPGNPASPFLYPHASTTGVTAVVAENPPIDFQRLMVRAEFIRPLRGMRVAFGGRLRRLSDEQAVALAARLGGTCQPRVDDSTNLLVLGRDDPTASGRPTSLAEVINMARALEAQGCPIRIVEELEFLELLVACPTS